MLSNIKNIEDLLFENIINIFKSLKDRKLVNIENRNKRKKNANIKNEKFCVERQFFINEIDELLNLILLRLNMISQMEYIEKKVKSKKVYTPKNENKLNLYSRKK